jgi:GntR family transcriptional repressor for pyruvate dehydrogenase complex
MRRARKLRAAPAAPATAPWRAIKPTPLSWHIVSQFRTALLAGRISAGEFLGTEGSLAKQFGVSRMVARDALRSLAGLGIVTIHPGAQGGARVAEGNTERFADALAIQLKLTGVSHREVIDAQMAVESLAAELAAARASAESRRTLRALLRESEGLIDSPDAFADSALRFHLAIAEASENRAIAAQARALRLVLAPALAERTTRERARGVVAQHRKILDCIEARDGEAARRAMAGHLEGVRIRGFSGNGHSEDRTESRPPGPQPTRRRNGARK